MSESFSRHLTGLEIRRAVEELLRSHGYEADTNTLRIYGYTDEPITELAHFQGHITVTDARDTPMSAEAIQKAVASVRMKRAASALCESLEECVRAMVAWGAEEGGLPACEGIGAYQAVEKARGIIALAKGEVQP